MSELALVDWGPFIASTLVTAEEERATRAQSWGGARRKHEVDLEQEASGAPVGDRRLWIMRRCLDQFEGFPRSDAQKRFHVEFIRSVLPHVYGADFERHRERVLQENNMVRIQSETLVCTPRRFGKTTAVSMFCAVLLATCPNIWISVFSTGQRASSSLLDLTAKFFYMLPNEGLCLGSNQRIIKKNQEQLWTRGERPDDVRKMFSYPSTVAGLKGVGGNVLVMEEASRLDEQVFKVSFLKKNTQTKKQKQ